MFFRQHLPGAGTIESQQPNGESPVRSKPCCYSVQVEFGRQFLRSKAEESTDYVKGQADNLKETAAEALERSKQTIQKHKENLASAVEAGKQAYREATTTPGD